MGVKNVVTHPTLPTRKMMSVCHWLASSDAMLSSNVEGVTKISGGVGFGGQNGACNTSEVSHIERTRSGPLTDGSDGPAARGAVVQCTGGVVSMHSCLSVCMSGVLKKCLTKI